MQKGKKTILILTIILLINVIFIDIVGAISYDNFSSSVVSCGNVNNIPASIPKMVNIIYNIIQIVVPIVLVIFGSLDLVKGIMGQKEDEIKKGQQVLIKRLVAAALIFFVLAAVKIVVSMVADKSQTGNMVDCIECFINNKCTTTGGNT